MKTKKTNRIFAVLLTVVMLLSAVPLSGFVGLDLFGVKVNATNFSGKCGDDLAWTLDTTTGEFVINGKGNMTYFLFSTSVPWNSYRSLIKSVSIGKGVTSIGRYAFANCECLISVSISDSVTSIAEYAFDKCVCLTSVTIGKNVTSIGASAFNGCSSLTCITIPDSVTCIDNSAFSSCTSLSSINIPNSVMDMGISAFEGCSRLKSAVIGNSVKKICWNTFNQCTDLENVKIGDAVTSIDWYAFYNCISLTSVTIPDSVTSIAMSAFSGCSRLKNAFIGNNVTSIDENAFQGCSSLTSIILPEHLISIGDSAFFSCSNLESVIIGNSVKRIGSKAFCGCKKLSSISIPKSVTSIDGHAFGFYLDYDYYKNTDFIIYCYTDSIGLNYAMRNGFAYELIDDPSSHTHLLDAEEVLPTCGTEGYLKTYCTKCMVTINYEVVPATGKHIDDNHDGRCDKCNKDTTEGCDCRCHKTGFAGFIYKIIRIFWKLFKTNQICDCGVKHY